MDDQPLALVLFSGTDDKLNAAAVMAAGAAALGRPVHVFLQYWALDAFRADRIKNDHGLAADACMHARYLQFCGFLLELDQQSPRVMGMGKPRVSGRSRGGGGEATSKEESSR